MGIAFLLMARVPSLGSWLMLGLYVIRALMVMFLIDDCRTLHKWKINVIFEIFQIKKIQNIFYLKFNSE